MFDARETRLLIFLSLLIGLFLSGCQTTGAPADLAWNELVAPHRHALPMEGYTLHYIDMGSGPPLMMLHGYASSGYAWNKNLMALVKAGFRVILVDLPGQGLSTVPPRSFSPKVENIAEQVISLADYLEFDTFRVTGCSMGGGITLFIAATYPERVKRAAVIDPACFDQEKPFSLKLLNNKVIGSIIVQFASRHNVENALKDTVYLDEVVTDTFVSEYARPLAKPGYKSFIGRLVREFPSERGIEITRHYDELKTPLLIIWGREDKWVPVEFGRRLNDLVPDSHLEVLDGIGHMPHLEAPEKTNELLIDFFSDVHEKEWEPKKTS